MDLPDGGTSRDAQRSRHGLRGQAGRRREQLGPESNSIDPTDVPDGGADVCTSRSPIGFGDFPDGEASFCVLEHAETAVQILGSRGQADGSVDKPDGRCELP